MEKPVENATAVRTRMLAMGLDASLHESERDRRGKQIAPDVVAILDERGQAVLRILLYPAGWYGFVRGDEEILESIRGRSFTEVDGAVSRTMTVQGLLDRLDDLKPGEKVGPARWNGPVS